MSESDIGIVEEAGVAFDPTSQHLDLSVDEKRRTTALMLAIQAYRELIIKEADYLREASNLAKSGDGPEIRPATIDAMVLAAVKFDLFISGEPSELAADGDVGCGGQTEAQQNTES